MPERASGADREGPAGPVPLAEDALRLVTSLQDWAQGWSARNRHEAAETHSGSECQWCPLCQFVAVLRGDRPEVSERIAEAGTAIAAAVRTMAEAASRDAGPSAPRREPPASAPRVQKIDLGDEA